MAGHVEHPAIAVSAADSGERDAAFAEVAADSVTERPKGKYSGWIDYGRICDHIAMDVALKCLAHKRHAVDVAGVALSVECPAYRPLR